MCPRPAALPDPGKPGLPKGERISAAADRASGHTAGDETKRMQRFKHESEDRPCKAENAVDLNPSSVSHMNLGIWSEGSRRPEEPHRRRRL